MTVLNNVTCIPARFFLCCILQWGQLTVSERTFTMPELQAAIQDGRVKEIFGSGTAATISPVAEIVYNGEAAVPITGDARPALRWRGW